jgi:hypothetical protein
MTTRQTKKPTQTPTQPVVEMAQQISLNFEGSILQVLVPIRVNGFEMMIATGIDVSKIPDEEWRKMQESRSKISLVIPQGLKIVQ